MSQMPQRGHQDQNSKNVLVCRGREAAPGYWPDGIFVKDAVGTPDGTPSLEASVIAKQWLRKQSAQGR